MRSRRGSGRACCRACAPGIPTPISSAKSSTVTSSDSSKESGVDAVTQYELWKAIWSALNDRNFFELAWALDRHNAFLDAFVPQTFVGNHDVTRLASRLVDPRTIDHALAVLFACGGTPSIYAGDEQAFRGIKENRLGGDDAVRPAFPRPTRGAVAGGPAHLPPPSGADRHAPPQPLAASGQDPCRASRQRGLRLRGVRRRPADHGRPQSRQGDGAAGARHARDPVRARRRAPWAKRGTGRSGWAVLSPRRLRDPKPVERRPFSKRTSGRSENRGRSRERPAEMSSFEERTTRMDVVLAPDSRRLRR